MRTLIAYCTKYGTTAACAQTLAREIAEGTVVVDLGRASAPALDGFDVALIGGSIYGGRIQRRVVSFCERNRVALLRRKVGVFLCCLYTGEEALVQLQSSFPDWLLAHAFAHALPGGELRRDRLSFVDRLLVHAEARQRGDILRLRPQALEEMAAAVKSLRRNAVDG